MEEKKKTVFLKEFFLPSTVICDHIAIGKLPARGVL